MVNPGSCYRIEKGHVLIPQAEMADLLARRDVPGPKSLRDEFAMAALTSLASDRWEDTHESEWAAGAAKLSYEVADAMMKARKQRP